MKPARRLTLPPPGRFERRDEMFWSEWRLPEVVFPVREIRLTPFEIGEDPFADSLGVMTMRRNEIRIVVDRVPNYKKTKDDKPVQWTARVVCYCGCEHAFGRGRLNGAVPRTLEEAIAFLYTDVGPLEIRRIKREKRDLVARSE